MGHRSSTTTAWTSSWEDHQQQCCLEFTQALTCPLGGIGTSPIRSDSREMPIFIISMILYNIRNSQNLIIRKICNISHMLNHTLTFTLLVRCNKNLDSIFLRRRRWENATLLIHCERWQYPLPWCNPLLEGTVVVSDATQYWSRRVIAGRCSPICWLWLGSWPILCDGFPEGVYVLGMRAELFPVWINIRNWWRLLVMLPLLCFQSTSHSAMQLWKQFVKKTKKVAPVRSHHVDECSFQEDLGSTLDQKWVTPSPSIRGSWHCIMRTCTLL